MKRYFNQCSVASFNHDCGKGAVARLYQEEGILNRNNVLSPNRWAYSRVVL